ncbi:MAG: hypothetical protein U1F35_16115 [Steroidobacteraceae bacterium]
MHRAHVLDLLDRCKFRIIAAKVVMLASATFGCAGTPVTDTQAAEAVAPAPPVDAALDDAAGRMGLPRNQVTVVRVEQVTWRDAALGCPEPDKMYTQALVAGYRITLQAVGNPLDYHADRLGRLLLCPPERAVAPIAPRARSSRDTATR